MNQDIIQKLNKLKNIEPDKDFAAYCRTRLLQNIQPQVSTKGIIMNWPKVGIHWPAFVWASGITALLLVVFASLSISNSNNILKTTSFDSSKLNQEFKNLSINIQLDEISYQQTANQTIASALTEISDNKVKHLNTSIIEKEQKNILPQDSNENKIDEMLKQVIF